MLTQVRRVVANDPGGESTATNDETRAAETIGAGSETGGREPCSGVGLALLRTRTDGRLPR